MGKINKAALKRLASEVRAELGVPDLKVLDLYVLAEKYGVRVYQLSDLDCLDAIAHFTLGPAVDVLSGALIPTPEGLVIHRESGAQLRTPPVHPRA